MKEAETKRKILEKGSEIIHKKGFNNTGIQEILAAAGIPKGSFYFYFKSKEDFGLQLIDFHAGYFLTVLDSCLKDEKLKPLERLRVFFDHFLSLMQENAFQGGCPLGNLAQEMSDQNELFRGKLQEVFEQSKNKIAECLLEARQRKELSSSLDVYETADFIFNSWHGALIRTKVLRSHNAYVLFNKMVFEVLLQGR